MVVFPKSKINLGLSVIEKRPDGFHNVETAMLPINLTDILELIPLQFGPFSFETSGFNISGDRKSNLVLKAWDIMQRKFDLAPAKIHLHKTIPSGAGLGGGSSDAAALVLLCNEQFNLNLSNNEMESLVRPLGSDCAFFIRSRTALATGKGDQLSPLKPELQKLCVVLVKPEIHINTAEAYSWIKPAVKKRSITQTIYSPVELWKGNLVNDFERPVFEKFPEIKAIRDQLYENGAIYASLTGTGAAVYGLFKEQPNLQNEFSNQFYWQGNF